MVANCDRIESILTFWFGPQTAEGRRQYDAQYRKAWFVKDAEFDQEIRQTFLQDCEQAAAGEYDDWLKESADCNHGSVALLLLLDQFPRNLFRGEPRSFATDPQALALAQRLVDSGQDRGLPPAYRFFVYVPFEHSENMAHQNRCVALMQNLVDTVPNLDGGLKGGLDYATKHRAAIERFGRFPHRNDILGRASTPAEIEFLKQPGSRF